MAGGGSRLAPLASDSQLGTSPTPGAGAGHGLLRSYLPRGLAWGSEKPMCDECDPWGRSLPRVPSQQSGWSPRDGLAWPSHGGEAKTWQGLQSTHQTHCKPSL